MNESLLRKIKALIAKGSDKSVTPAESQAFMAKAVELMAKHGLEMTDLPADAEERKLDIGKDVFQFGRRKREYDRAVGQVLRKCFSVDIVWVTGGEHAMWMIGTPEDTMLAREVIPMLSAVMSRGFLKWQRDNGITKWSSDEARAYYYGVADGYIKASAEGVARAVAQATDKQQECYAIMIINKADAIQAWKADNLRGTKPMANEKTNGNRGAYGAGYAKGSTLSLTPTKRIQ